VTAGAAPTRPRTLREEAISWAKSLGVALLVWIVLRSYLVEAFRIPSGSMENTLLIGDFLFVNKAAYGGTLEIPLTGIRLLSVPGYSRAHRDGIVIFRSVEDSTPNLDIVKRVIGEPGDTLRMVRDTIIRNGRRLEEPYALHIGSAPIDIPQQLAQMRERQLPHFIGTDAAHYRPDTHNWGPIVVPPDSFWVMGDNRDDSYDSRFWGFLPRSHIEGRPLFIYFSVATDPFRIRWNRLFRTP
jgi:signal peptidase I